MNQHHNSTKSCTHTLFCDNTFDCKNTSTRNHLIQTYSKEPTINSVFRELPGLHHPCSNSRSGYILYTVLIVLSLSFIIVTSLLYTLRSTVKTSTVFVQKSQARYLAESGIARAEFFLNGGDSHTASWETDAYVEHFENYGTLHIKCRQFGLFSLLQSTGSRVSITDTISGLTGRIAPKSIDHSLVLTSKSGGCLILGTTSIQGTIVLDHGYITNTPHGKRTLPHYEKRLFTRNYSSLPFDSSLISKHITHLKTSLIHDLQSDSTITGSYTFNHESDSLLLKQKIIIDGDCIIDCTIRNISIIASGAVVVTSKAQCKNISVSCDKLTLENGSSTTHSLFFSTSGITLSGGFHNSQFISTDSITTTDEISLGNANCIVSHRSSRKDSSISGGIYIPTGTHIKGTVISYLDPRYTLLSRQPPGASIRIGPGTDIKGYIITNHDIDIKRAAIEGSLWARSVVAFDNAIAYTNALIDITITPLKEDIVFPLLGNAPLKVIVNR